MAGHSKWANIKHRKARQDKKRGKLYTKLIREITVAAKEGSGDINSNPRLRTAVDKGKSMNLSNDIIERAIKRGAGGLGDAELIEVRYEGYGPGGVAVMVECMTDNHHRTVADVRHAFTKCGGQLGTDGSVAYLFTKRGQLTFEPGSDEERIMAVAIESGAEDVITNEDGSVDVWTRPEQFMVVKTSMEAAQLIPAEAEVLQSASMIIHVEGEQAEKMMNLIERLEDLDDVQVVYSNADI